MQQKAVEIDTKKQILGAVVSLEGKTNDDILKDYEAMIQSKAVDFEGNELEQDENGEPIIAENIDVAKMYKKDPKDRQYPVFLYHTEGNPEDIQAFILPVYGAGLWGPIWGFIALETDLETIKGVVFDHETETPGLGARITESGVQQRFKGKEIYDENGELVSVAMLKGENNPESRLGKHYVDGMSGATITADGVNDMLKSYLKYYENYLKKVEEGSEKVALLD